MAMSGTLRIFAYGTLKRGFSNHDRYCKGVIRIEPAFLTGRLLRLTPDIPVMVIPGPHVLAVGSRDADRDLALQEGVDTQLCSGSSLHREFSVRAGGRSASKTPAPGMGDEVENRIAGWFQNPPCPPLEKGEYDSWKQIRGEILHFDDPATRLPLLDELEEFVPGERSEYMRVLVRVRLEDGAGTTAWTYIAGAGTDTNALQPYRESEWL